MLLAWGASIAGPFHFDDYNLFLDPLINSARGWFEVWRPLQTRPLSQFTFWLTYMLAGATPWAFHLWNLVLHALASILVWRTLRIVVAERAALIAAIMFAVHPLQAEVVNYVFARSSALSTVLCLAVLWLWLRDRIWPAVAVFALALLAKEECVTFPLFLALLDWWRGKRRNREGPLPYDRGSELDSPGRVGNAFRAATVRERSLPDCDSYSVTIAKRRPKAIAAMLGLAFALGLRVLIATKFVAQGGGGFASRVTPLEYFTAQGLVILRYLRLLIVPLGFTVDPEIQVVLPWLAWFAVAMIVVIASRFFKGPGVWILAGLILLIPSSSIFPADDLAADRRMYLPMIAFCAAFAVVAQRWNPRVLMGLGAVLLVLSFMRTQVWMTERTLWQEAVDRAPDKVRPRIQLARSLNPSEGLDELDSAARRFPGDFDIETERGRLLIATGRAADALAAFGKALALNPSSAMALNNRGVALAALGQNNAARADFERALNADPCFAEAARNLRRLGFAAPNGLQQCLDPSASAHHRL